MNKTNPQERGGADAAHRGEEPHGGERTGHEHRHGVGTWVNTKLMQVIGPPPVGPYDENVVMPDSEAPCPLCGAPMSQHVIDRTGRDAELVCPTPPAPAVHEPTAP
ncbi:hypothetical protein [Cryobacterium tepidiphilum]|uniref:Type IV secretion protein Rhs n=1 Tax=Cryobacterium tepidiphilum TaxID=2486026 RepID=A0A3M8LM39_9MICO|nr:hypothetical protein [Cryobacterium tepidiphilum]RNE66583.1 hypothetical protein EEJ31_04075 [Cryobacterium tepidiphilum]